MGLKHGNEINKHPYTHQEFLKGTRIYRYSYSEPNFPFFYETGSSMHSDVLDGSGSSKNSHKHPDLSNVSGSSKLKEMDLEVDDRTGCSKNLKSSLEVINTSDSNGNSTIHIGGTLSKKLGSSRHPSSTSSDLSDLFQVDKNKFIDPEVYTISFSFPMPQEDFQQEFREDKSDISKNGSTSLGNSEISSPLPISTSHVSEVTHDSPVKDSSSTQSPQIQMMDRSGGYEHHRIPSAVFTTSKSRAHLEWSIASNESLFSIQLGNNSLSRDHKFLFSDLVKPGELTKSGELTVFSPPPRIPHEATNRIVELEKDSVTNNKVACEIIKDRERLGLEDQSFGTAPTTGSRNSANVSQISSGDTSGSRSNSFVPVKKKPAQPLRPFCYQAWPRCNSSWSKCYFPKCSCPFRSCWKCSCLFCSCWKCRYLFCSCWKCSRKRFCCHSPTGLTDGLQKSSVKRKDELEKGSIKTVPEQKYRNPPDSEVTPESYTSRHCFPFLSWFSRGCSCHSL